MSNEVNQAYLRAYIKNRVANSRPSEESTPLPPPANSPSGAADNIFRRADAGRAQPPMPRSSWFSSPGSETPIAEELDRVDATELSGVWSPLGAERGVKAAGVFRTQPAVVVNRPMNSVVSTTPAAPPPTASQPPAARTEARPVVTKLPSASMQSVRTSNSIHASPSPTTAAPVTRVPAQSPSQPANPPHSPAESATGPAPSVRQHLKQSPLSANIPTVRIDAAHARAASAHLRGAAAPLAFEQSAAPNMLRGTETVAPPKAPTTVPLPVAFRPSWEVDKFFWPEVLFQLQKSNLEAFEQIGRHLKLANQDGLQVMAITSGERGVGRSTVAMHLARAAAAAGLNVALVDADTCYPSVVDQLRLDMEHGWQDSLFENVPLEEVAVRSLEDNMTIFPLTSIIPAQQLHANLGRLNKLVRRIATAHDMVFLDSNRLNLEQRDMIGAAADTAIDAAIVVVDTELSIKEKVDTAISILQGTGVASIGLVENFHS